MRLFQNLEEAISESIRDLAEMGIVSKRYYQSQKVERETKELIPYVFKIIVRDQDRWFKNSFCDLEFCKTEFERRIDPLIARKSAFRPQNEVFEKLAVSYNNKKLVNYDYAERMYGLIDLAINKLLNYPESRQIFVPIYEKEDILKSEIFRVPCSIGYHFIPEKDGISMVYMMRSTDAKLHYPNDLTIAALILKYIAGKINKPVVSFSFFTSNFHEYSDELKEVF